MANENVSAITGVSIEVGSDGLGYYTTLYGNNKRGARSEGLGHEGQSEQEALKAAEAAARRDYPWLNDNAFHFEVE